MTRSLLLLSLLSGCSLGPVPALAESPDGGSAEQTELATPPADQAGLDTPCGSVTCTPAQFCVRRYSGIADGGLSADHCTSAVTPAPTCSDAWTNATCAPTPCRDVSVSSAGHFIDCWGQ